MANNGANKKQYIGTRVDSVLHEQIEHYLEKHGVSMSDFMRTSVERLLSEPQTHGEHSLAESQPTAAAMEALTAQLGKKDSQLEHLQTELSAARRGGEEASERSDMIIAQMTSQLDSAQLLLSDMRNRPSGWRRLFRWT